MNYNYTRFHRPAMNNSLLINSTSMFDSQIDLKKGKVWKRRKFWSRKRFWLIAGLSFTLTMILLALIFTLTLPLDALADRKCDSFNKESPICLSSDKNDIKRVYSTRTTFDQSVKLFAKLADPIDIPSTCKPIMFYLFSRHSIRYPKKDDIIEMSQILPKLQSEIINGYNSEQSELCEQDYQTVKDWKLQMVPENDNHVTPSGVEATKKIAGLFYERYPTLFDPSEVNFRVGITAKVRTNETAHAFVDGLHDLRSDININEEDYVIRNHLQFHSICKKKINGKIPESKQVKEITESKLFQTLRQRISKRMGLNRTIDDAELSVMYKTCCFEQAIYEKAPWCSLFTKKELRALETREDLKHYYKNGPGLYLNHQMPCPLIGDLYRAVIKGIAQPENKTTYLYFSHAGAISRLWAALGLFNKLELDDNFCPNGDRQWRTSLILPFNVNFDGVLYRCTENIESTNPSDYKLLTMINGFPVKIDRCDDPMCNASQFLKSYEIMTETCDLDQICHLPENLKSSLKTNTLSEDD
ncbi:multiple inositol polyphosphate phosphatase 1 isoform X2 [Tetranychus urticae]|nr:multiple inositol polyphosphate phosphatase 1 isoform X2 [Tetranychus urticae]